MALITGTDEGDVLNGTAEDDILFGGAGDDYLQGGGGDDRMDGGDGDDMVQFLYSLQGVVVDLGAGTATGQGNDGFEGIEGAEGSSWDDILTGDDGDNRLYGGGGSDTISGGGGNDRIDGDYYNADGAADRLDGGAGDDVVTLGDGDVAEGGDGIDTLEMSLSWRTDAITIDLSALWSGGAGRVGSGTVTGFERLGLIIATRGNDVITVGTRGLVADDDAAPLVHGWEGDDRLTGGEDRDRLVGGSGDDLLVALGGDDFMFGADGADRIEAGAGDDLILGGEGKDVLIGGAGSDTYDYSNSHPASEDSLVEQPDEAGIDRIVVRPYLVAVEDDFFAGVRNVEVAELVSTTDLTGPEFRLGAEFGAAGFATVIASADIDASAMTSGAEFIVTHTNIRHLTVTGGSGDDGFRFAPWTLSGLGDGFAVSGGEGFDTLYLDRPIDSYWFDDAVVIEGFEAVVITGGGGDAGGGATARTVAANLSGTGQIYAVTLSDASMDPDTLFTVDARKLGASATLQLDVSGLTGGRAVKVLAGAAADRLAGSIGNDALYGGGGADVLAGGAGDDRLAGGAGADTMAGGKGHDVYVVNNGLDRVVEEGSSGSDTVESAVSFRLPVHFEKLILTGSFGYDGRGNAGANTITGNAGGNLLNGGSGNDILNGGAGNDRLLGSLGDDDLRGGSGADRFEFTTALGAGNVDDILDFSAAADSIHLLRSVFGRAGGNGTLAAHAFRLGTAAADASDRIVYDAATGRIFYDADGNGGGAAVLFATVTPGTALTHADFVIYG